METLKKIDENRVKRGLSAREHFFLYPEEQAWRSPLVVILIPLAIGMIILGKIAELWDEIKD